MPTPVDELGSHAAHRCHRRAFHVVGQPWEPHGGDSYNENYRGMMRPNCEMYIEGGLFSRRSDINNGTKTARFAATADDTSQESDWNQNGIFLRDKGVIPFVWNIGNNLGGVSEDTIKAEWSGAMETFRMVNLGRNSATWCILGPEIW
jgi:hypothetical protein